MNKLIFDESLILKQMDFKENDKIITFLTKNNGKKSGILRGAKKPRSNWVSKTEPFTHSNLNYREKTGVDLVKVINGDTINNFRYLRGNYEKFLFASYFSELIYISTIPENESEMFFNLLLKALQTLSHVVEYPPQKILFEFQLLKILGFALSVDSCIICKSSIWDKKENNLLPKIKRNGNYQLDYNQGGISCPECHNDTSGTVNISPGTLAYYKSLELRGYDNIIHATTKNIKELDMAFLVYFRYYLGKIPKSHKLLPI